MQVACADHICYERKKRDTRCLAQVVVVGHHLASPDHICSCSSHRMSALQPVRFAKVTRRLDFVKNALQELFYFEFWMIKVRHDNIWLRYVLSTRERETCVASMYTSSINIK